MAGGAAGSGLGLGGSGEEVLVDEVDELNEGGSLVVVVESGTVEVDVDGAVVVGGDVVGVGDVVVVVVVDVVVSCVVVV